MGTGPRESQALRSRSDACEPMGTTVCVSTIPPGPGWARRYGATSDWIYVTRPSDCPLRQADGSTVPRANEPTSHAILQSKGKVIVTFRCRFDDIPEYKSLRRSINPSIFSGTAFAQQSRRIGAVKAGKEIMGGGDRPNLFLQHRHRAEGGRPLWYIYS